VGRSECAPIHATIITFQKDNYSLRAYFR
jgi:hypothetical protein